MSIRPLVKSRGKYHLASWITQNFPPNYVQMGYIEPYVQAGGVFFNKERSVDESINDEDGSIICIYKALRDEPGMFLSRLKRTKYCINTFNKALKKSSNKDYLDLAVTEFILRRMSRNGAKRVFAEDESWDSILTELPKIADRLQNVHIFNKSPIETLLAYDDKDMFTFVDPPLLAESADVNENKLSTDEHIELSEVLNQFRGRVMICGLPSLLYRRLYHADKGWKCIKRKTTVKTTIDCLWVNY